MRFHLIVLFLLSIVCVNAQDSKVAVEDFKSISIDSSISWMKQNAYSEIKNFHELALFTLNRANMQSDAKILAKVHTELANWHGYSGHFASDSVVYHSEKALSYYKETGDKDKVADTYRTLSIDYLNINKLEKAQEALFMALEMYEEADNESGIGKCYRSLSVLYRVMEDYPKSIAYTNKAVPILEKNEDYASLAIAQFNLIIGYGELGEYEKAYKATDYCLELIRTEAPKEIFVPVRAHSFRGDVYVKEKDYANALKDYTKAWELCVANIGEERCATFRTEIGRAYLLQKDYDSAKEHLLVGINEYVAQGKGDLISPYLDLAECYVQLGDFEKAMKYKDLAYENKTTILEGKVANLESEAVVKYETVKKDETIASQDTLIAQQKKTQLLYLVIAGLFALGLISMYFSIKNIRKKRLALQQLNTELDAKNQQNELLLKEIHHRVKNNLEMVKSLIALQSAQLDDKASKEAMLASQNRVQSMGIIHQKLYQGDNLGSIEMKDYFVNLSEGVLDTFGAEDKVKIECAMDNLELDVDTAVPIGLIVNELLTNALKYAFPEDQKGNIKISLKKEVGNVLKLDVADNGIGKIHGQQPKGTGFGSQLIQLLTQQLNGKMQEEIERGTMVSFQFKLEAA